MPCIMSGRIWVKNGISDINVSLNTPQSIKIHYFGLFCPFSWACLSKLYLIFKAQLKNHLLQKDLNNLTELRRPAPGSLYPIARDCMSHVALLSTYFFSLQGPVVDGMVLSHTACGQFEPRDHALLILLSSHTLNNTHFPNWSVLDWPSTTILLCFINTIFVCHRWLFFN